MLKTKRSTLDSAVPVKYRLTEAEFLEWLEKWDKLTWQIASKYVKRLNSLEIEEVYNEVQSGFFEASVRYDKRRNIEFQTYAYYYGCKAARELVRERHNQGFTHIGPTHSYLEKRAFYLGRSFKLEEDEGLENLIEDRDTQKYLDSMLFWQQVRKYLPEHKLFMILEARYKENRTLQEIGHELGTGREYIRQLQVKALGLLVKRGFLTAIESPSSLSPEK